MKKKIIIINGPNLNLLGEREQSQYGSITFTQLKEKCLEKTKELIKYDELNLSEIAYKLNYSSVAHLSKQFKQVTGMSPSEFKKQQNSQRKGIDQI